MDYHTLRCGLGQSAHHLIRAGTPMARHGQSTDARSALANVLSLEVMSCAGDW
jgi:hypothetical protein